MSNHFYPAGALIPDYLRAGAGFLLTGGPLLLAHPASVMTYVLGGLAALFLLYGARTLLRQMTRFELTETDLIAVGLLRATLRWHDLQGMELRYFSIKRDRGTGWMQLKLAAREECLRLDSGVTDFATIAARAAEEAERRGLALNETTRANLATLAIGFDPSPERAPAER